MWIRVRTPEGDIQDAEISPDGFIGLGDVLTDGSVVIDVPFGEEFPDEDNSGYSHYQDEEDDM